MTKGIKHKDIGEDLSRTEFEADDSHELESGTSFPGSPVEKDRFYRTDEHIWYIYNGSTWKKLGADWREYMLDAMIDGQGDVTYSSHDSIDGWNFFRDVTVNNAINLTVTGDTGGIICRNLVNNGTIIKSLTGGAGGNGGATPLGDGGDGSGMLFIIARTIDNNGIIKADGEAGANGATTGLSDKAGSDSPDGLVCLRYSTHTRGAGGNGGGNADGPGGTAGGGGGGGQVGNSGGDGGNGTYVTFGSAVGLDAAIMGMAYAESTYEYSGSGGGGGGANAGEGSHGGGGGGGGCIYISVGDFDNTGGTVQAIGGKGGNGGNEGSQDSGGGGGGGGIIYILYEAQIAAGTLTVTAGARGTGDNNGYAGVAGTATAVDVH